VTKEAKKRSLIYRILRGFTRIALVALTILLLFFILINLPATQKYLTQKAANYLTKTLDTEVEIGYVGWKLPKQVFIKDIYIETPKGDSLFTLGSLEAGVDLYALLQKKVEIKSIGLHDVKSDIFIRKDSSNIDFVKDAFFVTDSSIVEKKPIIEEGYTSAAWEILISDASLDLQNIDLLYDDEFTGLKLDLDLGKLTGNMGASDVASAKFLFENIALSDSDIYYFQYPSIDTSTPESTSDLTLGANKISIDNVHYAMKMDELELDTKIGEGSTENFNLQLLGNSVIIAADKAQVAESTFKYDLVDKPITEGFDASHMSLTDLEIEAIDFAYEDLDFELKVNKGKANVDNQIFLESLESYVEFSKEGLILKDFIGKTNRSQIKKSDIVLTQNFLDATVDLEDMGLDLSLSSGNISLQDAFYFSPILQEYFWWIEDNLQVSSNLSGSLKKLNVEDLNVQGAGLKLKARGQVQNTMTTELLAMDLTVGQFESEGANLYKIIPDSLLPEGTKLPDYLTLKGNIQGGLYDTLNLNIQARTNILNSIDTTRIDFAGDISNVMNDSLEYDFDVKNFTSTDDELYAYLPNNTLPKDYQLPNEIELSGRLKGTLNSLQPNILLNAKTPQGAALIRSKGRVENFNKPNLNLSLLQTQVDTNFLNYILPDSLLPAQIQIPNIAKGTIKLKGNLDKLQADINLATSAGILKADVESDNNKYNFSIDLNEFDLLEITNGSLNDSISKTDLNKVNIQITGTGQDLDKLKTARGKGKVKVQEVDSAFAGLQANIDLKNKGIYADIQFKDVVGAANLDVFYDLKNKYTAEGNLNDFNLEDIPYVRQPMIVNGNLDLSMRFDSLSKASGDLELQQFLFQYKDKEYPLEQFKANANFVGNKKVLLLRSDWLDANVSGNFVFEEIATDIQNLVNSYILRGEEITTNRNSEAKLNAIALWHNTDFLSSGIIPGLDEIDPFKIKVDFTSNEDNLSAELDFPKIVYQGNEINILTGNAETSADKLAYTFDIKSLRILGGQNMGELKLKGGINQGLLNANLINIDTTQATTLDIKTLLDRENGQYRLRFAENVILNNKDWEISPQNEINFNTQNIDVSNWKLSRGEKKLELESIQREKIVANFAEFPIEEILSIVQLQEYGSGIVNGKIKINDPLTDLRVDADIDVIDTHFYEDLLGDAQIKINNNRKADAFYIDFLIEGDENLARIKGVYDMGNPVDPLNFDADIKKLQLSIFERFADEYISDLNGILVAETEITGEPAALSLVGFAQILEGGLTIDELKTPLKFGEQKVDLDGSVIRFRNFEVFDDAKNKAVVNAFIITEDFREFEYDLDVVANNFLVLNTTEKDNDLYYGKMYADAVAKVSGDLFSPFIEVTASPQKNSNLTYIIPTSSTSIDYGEGVVRFVDGLKKETKEYINRTDTIRANLSQALNLTMNINIEINNNLDFTAVIDPVTDSQFSGKGEGFLSYTMYPSGEMEMSGTIKMKEGIYRFIYGEVVKRNFDVVEGSSLIWTGDIYNPNLDLKVQYKTKASPLGLIGSNSSFTENQENELRVNQTFIVELGITGSLEKTDIATTLLYPDISENSQNPEIVNAVNRLQQNQNQMHEQAFGLILFNSFVSENLNIGASVLNVQGGINNVISGQLNNLASRYIKFVELDFGLDNFQNYDSESGQTSNGTNLNLTIRKRFFKDRLIVSIDGESSSSLNSNEVETQIYLDNLTVEYSLTKNGHWRVKVYNKRDRDDVLATDVIKTGMALVISKDFDELRIFKKKK